MLKQLRNLPKLVRTTSKAISKLGENLFPILKMTSRWENFMEKLIFMMFGIHIEHVLPIVININIWTVQLRGNFPEERLRKLSLLFSIARCGQRHIQTVMKNSIEFQFSFRKAMFYVSLSIKNFRLFFSFLSVGRRGRKEIILKKLKAHDWNIKNKNFVFKINSKTWNMNSNEILPQRKKKMFINHMI